MAVALDQDNDLRYTVPSWFLENKIRTNEEADGDETGIAVVDDPLGEDEGEKRPAIFEILKDDYDAIQLTAAAALIRDDTGALSAKTPSMFLDMKEDDKPIPGGFGYFDCLVKQLGRDLGAVLISVSPDDLEELGRAFYAQDQKRQEDKKKQVSSEDGATENNEVKAATDEQALPIEEPDWDSAYPLVQFYFSVRSERNGTAEAQKRSKAAINALLDSAQIKRGLALEKEPADGGSLEPLVLLHLMDLQLLEYKNPLCRLLHRFASRLEERRTGTKGGSQRILGIASETSGSLSNTECRKFLSDEYRTFRIPLPPNYFAQKDFYMRSKSYYIRMRNTCRFKTILQARLPKAFEPGLLDLCDSEHIQQRWQNEVFPGGKACSANDLDRAAIQVAGRQWKNPTLTLDDVIAVTTRMRRRGNWDSEEELKKDKKQEKNEEQGSDNQNPWEGLTLKQRQDKVSPRCDDYESKLLNCIVNPEELSTTYDDVIIDEETKEHVKQLVSLSRMRLEAASKTLLQNLRVSGALFYGAPGTGKTLLCKAIANDSGSNMLALSPSQIFNHYVGQSEKTISAAFSLAAKLSPCVLFIDEVDALFYRRSSSDKSWERSALNQFLQEMDGLTTLNKDNVPFVIVGTNRPADLDDAFLRRLPHKVLFTLPATTERERILRVFLQDGDVDPQLDFNDLANQTKGFSGSDLRSLCGQAALAWAVEQSKKEPSRDVSTIRIHLQKHHFDVALRKTKPSVSPKSTKVLEEFAKQFNPEDYNRSSGSVDTSNVTSKASSTPTSVPFPSQAPSCSGVNGMLFMYSAALAAVADETPKMLHEGIPGFTQDQFTLGSLMRDDLLPAEAIFDIEAEPDVGPTEYIFDMPPEPADLSLGRVTEDCLGIVKMETSHPTFETTDVETTAIVRALTNWYRLQWLVSQGAADKIFSWKQRHSYQMLFDWWSASLEDPSKPLTILLYLIHRSEVLRDEFLLCKLENRKEFWFCTVSHLDKLYQAGGRFQSDNCLSIYGGYMWKLFLSEFYYPEAYAVDRGFNMKALTKRRHDAVEKGYCHLAAMKCSGCLLPDPPLHNISNELFWVLSVEASDPSYPRTLSRGPLIRACPWLDPSPSTSSAYSQQITHDEDGLGGWPEYLWDILDRRVVKTRDLQDQRPPYIAISHTWGRWQSEGQWVQMEGGLELPVPCNRVFDVSKLPQVLTKLKSLNNRITVDYVWLDLLCIPQVPLGGTGDVYEPWIPIQMREIARQGSIFRNAVSAIAWFHDINSFSCLGGLFELFSLPFLTFGPGSTDDSRLKNIEEAAYCRVREGRTGFMSISTGVQPMENWEPCSWFTSLWTLQELCLRPDMWLATSDWNILTVGQDEPVPLSGFMCVYLKGLWDRSKVMTEPAALEITQWVRDTGLVDLLELSQVGILQLGDRRQCSGKRAEAIMSAIGATKWFSRETNHEENLVLGIYPLEFIQEVRESVSGAFFTTCSDTPAIHAQDVSQITNSGLDSLDGRVLAQANEAAEIRGSLLPFGNIGHFYLPMFPKYHHLNTHNSVCTWKISTSGMVKIENACILSSSTLTDIPRSPEMLSCSLMGYFDDLDDEKRVEISLTDMHKWTSTRKSEIHLVVVMHSIIGKRRSDDEICEKPAGEDPFIDGPHRDRCFRDGEHTIQGIVLRSTEEDPLNTAKNEEKTQGADAKPQRLVTIGNFSSWGPGDVVLPKTRRVSWEIL